MTAESKRRWRVKNRDRDREIHRNWERANRGWRRFKDRMNRKQKRLDESLPLPELSPRMEMILAKVMRPRREGTR